MGVVPAHRSWSWGWGGADELRECQVGSLSRHHIRQRWARLGGPQGLPQGLCQVGWEIREGLAGEVAWEVGLGKRKGLCAESLAVAAGGAQGGSWLQSSWESWGVFGPVSFFKKIVWS